MTIDTIYGKRIDAKTLHGYLTVLINRIFKILPIREQEEDSLSIYIRSLISEILGCGGLVDTLNNDPDYLTLIAILQYIGDHTANDVRDIRREVFRAISICNKLKAKYSTGGDEHECMDKV